MACTTNQPPHIVLASAVCATKRMTSFTEDIYYADNVLLERIKDEFHLIEAESWHELYQHKTDSSFWRLDVWDKYQQQFFVRLITTDNWTGYDDKELRIGLLLKTRNTTDEQCAWKDCNRPALKGLAICERHAYEEMGIRK